MNKEGLHILKLDAGDLSIFQKLIVLFRETFEMEDPSGFKTENAEENAEENADENADENVGGVAESYLTGLLERSGFIVYVALYQNEIVGGLTAHALPLYYSEQSEIYIYDIAVKAIYQRKGVGKALLSSLIEYCRDHGIKEVFVDADERDEHALDFYHATGGKAAKVVHFTYAMS